MFCNPFPLKANVKSWYLAMRHLSGLNMLNSQNTVITGSLHFSVQAFKINSQAIYDIVVINVINLPRFESMFE